MTRKSLKFLVAFAVVNTALFTGAKVLGFSIGWVLVAEIVLFAGYILVKTWRDPAQQLVNQGAHMGWVAAGTVRDENGLRDTLLRRQDMIVRVSYKEKTLYIVEPRSEGPYRDFVELERILTIYG